MKHRESDIDQGDTGEWFLGLAADTDASTPAMETVAPFAAPPSPVYDRSPMPPLMAHRRTGSMRRWLIALAVAVVAVWMLVWLLPQIPQRQAESVSDRYRVALDALFAALPGADVAAQAVADPGIPVDRLGEVVPGITVLAQAGGAITDLAAEPLPAPPPLVPAGPIDDLVPLRSRLGMLGPEADAAARHINDVLTYRTLSQGILDVEALPVEADTAQTNRLSVLLASALADATGVLGGLPDVPSLAAHRARLDEGVLRFEDWQVEYLDTLRRGDGAAATVLVAELAALQDVLATSLRDALGATGRALATDVDALDASIASARSLLGD